MSSNVSQVSTYTRRLALGLAVPLILIITLLSMSVAGAASVSPVQNVSNDSAESIGPQVAQDPDGNVHVVWGSLEGDRRVRYAKGTWNGSTYQFGSSFVIAEVGSFGYASPAVAVAPNGTIMVAWSDGTLNVQTWNARDSQPGGTRATLGAGIQPSIAPDSANRFHIVWNGDFRVQYCEREGGSCRTRDAWSSEDEGSAAPDIAVDSNNGVHVVWGGSGQRIGYRARGANAGWGAVQQVGNGISPQITADGRGSAHIVWSHDFNVQYCRKTLTSACDDVRVIDAADDLSPSIGATREGNVAVVFRDSTDGGRKLWYAVAVQGSWSSPQQIADGPTAPDITSRPYVDRVSVVWSLNFDTHLVTISALGSAAPAPTQTATPVRTATPVPTPTRPPAPPTGSFDFADNAFRDLWTRTDSLVARNAVSYSWIWGPSAFTQGVREFYVQSPGQARLVQYFDKSRMEINQPNAPRNQWYVTNGRLADELITGLLQVGDAQYEQRSPAAVPVAGDPSNTFPLYRDLQAVYRRSYGGDRANQELYRAPDGSVRTQLLPNANNDPSMVITQRVSGLGIPKIFWDFMNQPGQVVENGRVVTADPFFDWRFVAGEPLTEAYWVFVKVNGIDRGVLVQAFERRVLTYNPANPPGFQVEMGNIGRHYFEWRYGVRP